MKPVSVDNSAGNQMLAFWDRLEYDIAQSICKLHPTDPQWQPFSELLASSLNRVLSEFPGTDSSSLEIGLVRHTPSPIDDALREARVMYSIALEKAGLSRQVADLLLSWLDFRADARTVELQIASKRLHLELAMRRSAEATDDDAS